MMKNNRKGFTLAELLIVVAIIAVLVAIAIPVFTTQLEKSREATDVANVRSAYATLVAGYLEDNKANSITIEAQQKVTGWATKPDPTLQVMVDGESYSIDIPASTSSYTVSISEAGKVTVSGGGSTSGSGT